MMSLLPTPADRRSTHSGHIGRQRPAPTAQSPWAMMSTQAVPAGQSASLPQRPQSVVLQSVATHTGVADPQWEGFMQASLLYSLAHIVPPWPLHEPPHGPQVMLPLAHGPGMVVVVVVSQPACDAAGI